MALFRYFPAVLLLWTLMSGTPSAYFYTSNGTITFRSEAPQEHISASSAKLIGIVDNSNKTFVFKIAVRSFEGFNSHLQKEHFNEKYLESEKFEDAQFSGKIIEQFDLSKDGEYAVRAKGKLTIHGVSQERIIKGVFTVRNGKINLHSTFTILLTDFNIKIPKVVHEKVSSEIELEVRTELKKK